MVSNEPLTIRTSANMACQTRNDICYSILFKIRKLVVPKIESDKVWEKLNVSKQTWPTLTWKNRAGRYLKLFEYAHNSVRLVHFSKKSGDNLRCYKFKFRWRRSHSRWKIVPIKLEILNRRIGMRECKVQRNWPILSTLHVAWKTWLAVNTAQTVPSCLTPITLRVVGAQGKGPSAKKENNRNKRVKGQHFGLPT